MFARLRVKYQHAADGAEVRSRSPLESAKMLAEVAKQKGISLCGIQRDQTTADFSNQNLQPPDAILLASDLSQAVVTGAINTQGLGNCSDALCGVGADAQSGHSAEIIVGEVQARQPAFNADHGGDHNRRGNSKILAREVERLDGVGALELLDRESIPVQVHLCIRDLQKSVQEGAHQG